MTIRWRLVIGALQVAIILSVTGFLTGRPLSEGTWFASTLALSLNVQLLEPYFARPVDTLANSVVGLVLAGLTPHEVAGAAWIALEVLLGLAAALAATALAAGAGRQSSRLGITCRALSRDANARTIYSALFWLSLLESAAASTPLFWKLSLTWVVPIFLGSINWQAVLAAARGAAPAVTIEGMIGPHKLLVSSTDAPPLGEVITLETGSKTVEGVVVGRIRRPSDTWLEIHVPRREECERLVAAQAITLARVRGPDATLLGVVEASSDHTTLVFSPLRPLTVGHVVSVAEANGQVLYQITRARIDESSVRGGSHLSVIATAHQLGVFSPETNRLRTHAWVPQPGAPVVMPVPLPAPGPPPQGAFLLGYVVGTRVPIYLDLAALGEGHLAIVGMTRMGKTTFALRLAAALAASRSVVVMDQTGEYRARHGLGQYVAANHGAAASLSVFEPVPGRPVPDEGLTHLRQTLNAAFVEYQAGHVFPRTLVIDEAHQFLPEPAMLGFGSPGRESAITFGMYMMQVRKYGLSVVLISQRTAVVAKSGISQCENLMAFKSVDQTGLDYLESVLGHGARDILPALQQGQALVYGPAVSSDTAVAITVEH